MNQLLRLAWRNIGRKRRRSLIAISSVAFALLVSISLRSLMLGNYDKMIEAGTKNVGHLQIHSAGYWTGKSINELMTDSPARRQQLAQAVGITHVLARLQNGALASGEKTTKAVQVNGIDPDIEDGFTNLSGRLSKGSFIKNQSTGVVMAEGLARYLKLGVGDTVVLIGQGYQANIAAGKYPIQGMVRLGNPQLNLSQVYMPLPLAQAFFSADGLASAYLLTLVDANQTDPVKNRIQATLGNGFEVMTWNELLPEIKNSQRIDTTIFTLLSSCLYLIIGMGLIGTVLMMTLERRREFGILQAIGLQKSQIRLLIILESLLLGFVGVVVGLALALPFVLYMNAHPIPLTGESGKSFEAMGVEPVLQLGLKPHLFALMGSIVLAIMGLATLVPMGIVSRLKTSEAIK
ncbi:ABC transporter permease [Fibrella sp. HMF5335]|uniref:ABC transporter permease n=1 Tax=Fibrella rubiginis TaxID=2817060 RepID=A0A939K7E8_9BACT|nr:FtsX-like permease family protein [Fibrella rubiginis]MBO0939341.1 ABC transporter permease [Fibrella rubiginis]